MHKIYKNNIKYKLTYFHLQTLFILCKNFTEPKPTRQLLTKQLYYFHFSKKSTERNLLKKFPLMEGIITIN